MLDTSHGRKLATAQYSRIKDKHWGEGRGTEKGTEREKEKEKSEERERKRSACG